MAKCDVCGNDYPRSFEVITADGKRAVFDSLECAAHRIAPTCAHCNCRILGHGIQDGERVFCCAHCARHAGVDGVVDNSACAA